ncbi:MAG: glycosyltransferase [Pseudomonadota bacterium]
MRVLHINNVHHVRGGSDVVYFKTGDLLTAAGHDCTYFASAHPANRAAATASYFPKAVENAQPRRTEAHRFLFNASARAALTRLIAEQGPFDIAHLHIYHGRLTAAILEPLRRAGIPVVQTLHEYKPACPVYTMERDGQVCEACLVHGPTQVLRHRCKDGSLDRSLAMLAEYWAARLLGDRRGIDRFICVSAFQRDIMRRAGLPEQKLRLLHNFVAPAPPMPQETADPQRPYLLYAGRIDRLKGVPMLIEAVKRTGDRLVLAGDGPWSTQMAEAITDYPAISAMGFLQPDALQTLVAGARAVVVPSVWYENCPLSVLEAKALGVPVIAARIGGVPELVRDGVDGLLFRAGDVADLQRALAVFATSDRDTMSAAAKDDATARFAPDVHLPRLLSIYDEARGARAQAA